MVVRIEVFRGVVRCREARRVLKNFYPHGRSTPPWSCVDYGVEMVQCTQPEGAFRGIVGCRVARPTEVRAACPPGFELPALATPGPRGAELYPVPARKSCGHSRIAPPGDHPLILVEVVFGRVPCRVARRVLTTQYRNGSQDDAMQAALPWSCGRAEGLIVCHNYSGRRSQRDQGTLPPAVGDGARSSPAEAWEEQVGAVLDCGCPPAAVVAFPLDAAWLWWQLMAAAT